MGILLLKKRNELDTTRNLLFFNELNERNINNNTIIMNESYFVNKKDKIDF
jgi:hypothetical protein